MARRKIKASRVTALFANEFDKPSNRQELKYLIREAKEDTGMTKNKELEGEVADKLMEWADNMKDDACCDCGIFLEIIEDAVYSVDWFWVANFLLTKHNKKGI